MKGEYQVVVFRRHGVTMQTFNADTLTKAWALVDKHKGMADVYKITLSVYLEVFDVTKR